MKSKVMSPGRLCVRIFLAAIVFLAGLGQTRAATINAASVSFADVSNAVAQAAFGDTVLLPPGTNSWSKLLNIRGITLQGSGVSSTVIRDESPMTGIGNPFMQLSVDTTNLTRVTQIQFTFGVTNNFPYNNYNGCIAVYGGGQQWRIDHCYFNNLTGKEIKVGDASYGLIDHNYFLTADRLSLELFDSGYGDTSWSLPDTFGTSKSIYIEDNTFFDTTGFSAVDVSNGGRAVFRHNTMSGAYFNTHGLETSQRYRSFRQIEVYNNSFTWGGGQQYNNFYTMCDIRGGTGVVFSNTAVGFWSIANLDCYRATDNDPNFLPWFGATGLRGWDSNGPALLTGNASVTTNMLVVAGANWTSNQWYGCTVYNYSNQLCGIVTSSSANTMQFKTSRTAALQLTFKAGDPFVVHLVYPMMDQPGMGQGNLLSGDSPTPVYLNETNDPVYCWSNSLAVMYQSITAEPSAVSSPYPDIQPGRDYFNAPKPGYAPFTYPHPLTLITNAVSVTNTNAVTGPTNIVTNTNLLSPPTGLNVHGLQ